MVRGLCYDNSKVLEISLYIILEFLINIDALFLDHFRVYMNREINGAICCYCYRIFKINFMVGSSRHTCVCRWEQPSRTMCFDTWISDQTTFHGFHPVNADHPPLIL